MRLLLLLLASLISNVIFAQADEICKELHHIIEMEQHAHEQIVDFRTNPLTTDYDLKYHRLEWEVDPGVFYISGTVTSYFVPTTTDFDRIHFDLAENMTVNQVSYHGNPLMFNLNQDDVLEIVLPNILAMGQLDSIQVSYEGAPSSDGFGAFEQDFHQGTPVLWTLSEPYGAKNWWPCKQDLTDKIDSIDVIVRTPQVYRVASNGVLVGEEAVGSDKIYHWKHRHPIVS